VDYTKASKGSPFKGLAFLIGCKPRLSRLPQLIACLFYRWQIIPKFPIAILKPSEVKWN